MKMLSRYSCFAVALLVHSLAFAALPSATKEVQGISVEGPLSQPATQKPTGTKAAPAVLEPITGQEATGSLGDMSPTNPNPYETASAGVSAGAFSFEDTALNRMMNFDDCMDLKLQFCAGPCPYPQMIGPGIKWKYQEPTALVEVVCNPGKSYFNDQQNIASRLLVGGIGGDDVKLGNTEKCFTAVNTGTGYMPRYYFETHVWGTENPDSRYFSSASFMQATNSIMCSHVAKFLSMASSLAGSLKSFNFSEMDTSSFMDNFSMENIKQSISDFGTSIQEGISDLGTTIADGVSDLGTTIADGASEFGDMISEGASSLADQATAFGESIAEGVSSLPETISSAVDSGMESMSSAIEGGWSSLESGMSDFGGSLESLADAAANGDPAALNHLGSIAETVGSVGQYVSMAGSLTGNEELASVGGYMSAAGALSSLKDIDFTAVNGIDFSSLSRQDLGNLMKTSSKVLAPFAVIDPRFGDASTYLGMGSYAAKFDYESAMNKIEKFAGNASEGFDDLFGSGGDLDLDLDFGDISFDDIEFGMPSGEDVGNFFSQAGDVIGEGADWVGNQVGSGSLVTRGDVINGTILAADHFLNNPARDGGDSGFGGLGGSAAWPGGREMTNGATQVVSAQQMRNIDTVSYNAAVSSEYAQGMASAVIRSGVKDPAFLCTVQRQITQMDEQVKDLARYVRSDAGKSEVFSAGTYLSGDRVQMGGSTCPLTQAGYVRKGDKKVYQNCEEQCITEMDSTGEPTGKQICKMVPKDDMFGRCDKELSTYSVDGKFPACDGTMAKPVYKEVGKDSDGNTEYVLVGYKTTYDPAYDDRKALNDKYQGKYEYATGQASTVVKASRVQLDDYVSSVKNSCRSGEGSCGCDENGQPVGDWGVEGDMGTFDQFVDENGDLRELSSTNMETLDRGADVAAVDYTENMQWETVLFKPKVVSHAQSAWSGLVKGAAAAAAKGSNSSSSSGGVFGSSSGGGVAPSSGGGFAPSSGADSGSSVSAGTGALNKMKDMVSAMDTVAVFSRSGTLQQAGISYAASMLPFGLTMGYLSEMDSGSWRQSQSMFSIGISGMIANMGHPLCSLTGIVGEAGYLEGLATTTSDFLGCIGTWGAVEPKVGWVFDKNPANAAALAGYRGHKIALGMKSIRANTKGVQQFNLDFPHKSDCYNVGTAQPQWQSEGGLDPIAVASSMADQAIGGTLGEASRTARDDGYIFTYWKKTSCCIWYCYPYQLKSKVYY